MRRWCASPSASDCAEFSRWTGVTFRSIVLLGSADLRFFRLDKADILATEVRRDIVIDLKYSLVIEATDDPTFFGFYSPDLEGFTGIGHSIEDCLYQAKWGMEEHVELLKQQSLPIPKANPDPKITIQNQESLAQAS